MSKRKKSQRQRRRNREEQRRCSPTSQTERWLLRREEVSVSGEADRIVRLAQASDARVVTLGALVFFSTETGDAWMLDAEDGSALCLARDRERQPFAIAETSTRFAV